MIRNLERPITESPLEAGLGLALCRVGRKISPAIAYIRNRLSFSGEKAKANTKHFNLATHGATSELGTVYEDAHETNVHPPLGSLTGASFF